MPNRTTKAPTAARDETRSEDALRSALDVRSAVDARPGLDRQRDFPGLGSGRPLDRRTRRDFESRFQFDFGSVRVHDDSRAAGLTRELGARAITLGDHIVFDAGELAPATSTGRRLLAHELAHVVQQGRGQPTTRRTGALEADARRGAERAVRGESGDLVRLGSPVMAAFQRRSSAPASRSGPSVVDRAATEARVQSEVQRIRPDIPMGINVFGMMTFDSTFYGDNRLFDFRGRVMRGWEVNYYFISMAMAHQGYSWDDAQDMIWTWNMTQYVMPGDPDMTDEMWFAARQGYDDEIRRLPPRPAPRPRTPLYVCFSGETEVLLADGREVPIRDLEVGQRVLAVDERTGRVEASETIARAVHPAGRVRVHRFANGRSQQVTANHPIFVGGRWVPAGTARPGDLVTTLSPGLDDLAELAIEAVDEDGAWVDALYDITVAPHHNFFAAGTLVHNK